MTPPVKSGPRYNQMIVSDKVRVIDENGENLGVMYTREAIEQAAEVGLDLVEISPNADPPVAKFLDVGKFRYEAQAGNVGINIGVAAPMAFFPFSGWKESFFGTLHGQGKHAVEFFTQTKVVVERWPKEWSRQF